MTSLTPLAQSAAHATSPAFNGLFYATAATIIPVLFLAIALQGRMYEDLLKAASDAVEHGLPPGAPLAPGPRRSVYLHAQRTHGRVASGPLSRNRCEYRATGNRSVWPPLLSRSSAWTLRMAGYAPPPRQRRR